VIDVIHGVVTVGGVEYPVQVQIQLPDPVRRPDKKRKGK
jgi:hypothetical protein